MRRKLTSSIKISYGSAIPTRLAQVSETSGENPGIVISSIPRRWHLKLRVSKLERSDIFDKDISALDQAEAMVKVARDNDSIGLEGSSTIMTPIPDIIHGLLLLPALLLASSLSILLHEAK